MTYNPAKHHRRSIRLKGYDYSQSGLYFITICCQNKACIFGYIENGIMILNHAGQMIENEWLRLPQRFQNIQLHEFIVMPNHFHAILEIVGSPPMADKNITNSVGSTLVVDLNNIDRGQPQGIATTEKTVGGIVGAFKSITTVEYISGVKKNDWQVIDKRLWQRNYHEHIIRNEQSYINISNYIINNPAHWDEDVLQ